MSIQEAYPSDGGGLNTLSPAPKQQDILNRLETKRERLIQQLSNLDIAIAALKANPSLIHQYELINNAR